MTKSKSKKTHIHKSGCSYCGEDFKGLPHTCKYCGLVHCSEHLLPENHECRGLSHVKKWNLGNSSRTEYETETAPYNYATIHHSSAKNVNKKFEFPRIRLPRIRINSFFKALILAVLSFFLAVKFYNNSLILWLEAGIWFYFAFVIYRGAFRWANRVSMADDLSFFGLRILGGIVALVGFYFGFVVLIASFISGGSSAPMNIPLFALVSGLILLSAFIAFRTNRRHHVTGFWRA